MRELLPCPFCGGEAVLHQTYDMDTGAVDGWFAWCDNDTCECKPETGQFFTEAEAIAAWNTRVDYHGYEQAAIEAWESIKAWNSRAERICHWEYPQSVNGWVGYMVCSSCGEKYDETVADLANYCPNCGAKVVSE